MSQQLPILYTFIRCPYAMRARIALAKAGVEYEHREVNLRDKPEHMLEVSPKGTVPILLLADGTVIDESFDIVVWALADSTTNEMLELIKYNDTKFKYNIDRYKYPNRYPEETNPTEHFRNNAQEFVNDLESRLEKSSFLFGEELSAADICIFPFVCHFSKVDEEWFADKKWNKNKE